MYDRWYASELQSKLNRPYVHLLFGARQTGKSTLLNSLIPEDSLQLQPRRSAGTITSFGKSR